MVSASGAEIAVQAAIIVEVMDTHPDMKDDCHYYGLSGLTIGDMIGRRQVLFSDAHLSGRRVIYSHMGRCCLGLLCRQWKLKSTDEILMPAYNCGSEISPFVYYGLSVKFYRVDTSARIDYSDLFNRVTSRTRVLYVTHYFGWPHEIRIIAEYCRQNNLYLIEDCALSLFSEPSENPIGVFGDAAIYSFPKSLPVPDGGALITTETIPQFMLLHQAPRAGDVFHDSLPLIKRTFMRMVDRLGCYSIMPKRMRRSWGRGTNSSAKTYAGLPEMPKSYYYDNDVESLSMSRMTSRILRHTCPEVVVCRRRANYSQLYHLMADHAAFNPLYRELPEGVCPLFMGILLKNRESVCERLQRAGVMAISWWAGYHKGFDWQEFPESRYLKDHLLAIPIHQQLSSRDIEGISRLLKKVLSSSG